MDQGDKRLQSGILLGFLAAMLAMGYLAWNAYKSVEHLAEDLQSAGMPNPAAIQARELANVLNSMESSALRFALTGHAGGLDPYYIGALELPDRIRALKSVPSAPPEASQAAQRASAIGELLEKLVLAAESGKAPSSFDRFAASLDTLPISQRAQSLLRDTLRVKVIDSIMVRMVESPGPEADPERTGFLKNLFKSREKRQASTEPVSEPAPTIARRQQRNVQMDTLKAGPDSSTGRNGRPWADEIRLSALSLQEAENKAAQAKADTVMALASELDRQSQHLYRLIQQIEARQLASAREVAEAAKNLKVSTLQKMAWLGGSISVIFALLLGVIFYDIRTNRRLNQKLREEKQLTENLSHAREAFMTRISHDLRTPMHAVLGFSEQLGQTELTERQRRFVTHIGAASTYLVALLNDILDLAKLQHPGFSLEKKPFSLVALLSEAGELFKEQAKGKGLGFDMRLSENLPKVLAGDPLRLRQILYNLLGNALKFTEQGSITLEAVCKSPFDGHITFVISDTGIGISEERIPFLFEAFNPAGEAARSRYGGHGLGLSITKKLIDLHQGEISITSTPGKGTRITIAISLEAAAALEENQRQSIKVDLKGLKVLAADDEPFNRELLKAMLEKQGVEVTLAEDGAQALEACSRQHFDMVLLDLHMPLLDGIATAAGIREHTPEIPILGLTAAFGPQEAEQGKEAGFSAYLLKPFREEALLKQMALLLERPCEPPIPEEAFSLSPPEMPAGGIDLPGKYATLGKSGGSPFIERMLRLFVENGEKTFALMELAAQHGDSVTLGELAHKWGPSCRHIGALETAELLKELEEQSLKSGSSPEAIGLFIAKKEVFASALQSVKADLERLKT